MRRFLLVAIIGGSLCGSAWAQEVPPAMFVSGAAGKKKEALPLAKVKIEARIFGYLAETRMTLTFSNPHDRALAGDLYFPLPEGATVTGYALDINGVMVDGVVVEKQKARQTFEKIVRQGIDPGIVEWVKGNNFKTRVFPIPAQGTRTVMIKYVTDLVTRGSETTYRLPLKFKTAVKDFSLRVEVVKSQATPEVKTDGAANFAFKKWRDNFVAETALKDASLTEDLTIVLPDVEKQQVLVERASDGEVYFCINDNPPILEPGPPPKPPERITIFWDCSGSRDNAGRKREIALIRKLFVDFKSKKIEVELVPFRNVAGKAKRFVVKGGKCDELVAELEKTQYDGGTQMGAISPKPDEQAPDFYLLFSDGLSNFGKDASPVFRAPVYVLSADSSASHSFLRYLASITGGAYYNLNRVTDETVLAGVGKDLFCFLSATIADGKASEIYPSSTQPVQGRFAVVGKLAGKKAKIELTYGVNAMATHKVTHEVLASDAVDSNLVRLFWAQTKLQELQMYPERNKQEMVALGKRHGLVTPGTSLIVLERLEQYVEHRIVPPESLPKMRKEYEVAIAKLEKEKMAKETDKIERVLALWKARLEWWNKEFKYPKDFRYKAKKEGKDGDLADLEEEEEEEVEVPITAVPMAMNWLQTQMGDDGSWENDIKTTSLGLLVYLGHGETPASRRFGRTVENAIRFLLYAQKQDGRFGSDLEGQALAAYALSETYTMTRMGLLKEPAEKATEALIKDMAKKAKSSGWEAAALKSAHRAHMEVEGLDEAIKLTVEKLKKQDTAGALLGLQMFGEAESDEAKKIAKSLEDLEFDWKKYTLETLLFAHQAKFNQGGEVWRKWNDLVLPKLVRSQTNEISSGPDRSLLGYWLAPNEHDRKAGKVYCTVLATRMLEIYYRYLPTFARLEQEDSAFGDALAGGDVEALVLNVSIVELEILDESVEDIETDGAFLEIGDELGGLLGGDSRAARAKRFAQPGIAIKAWDPKTPYIEKLKKASPKEYFAVYMEQRAEYGKSPAFFLDCADFLLKKKQDELALQVLSNVAELELENAALLRILAHKLAQIGRLDLSIMIFEEILRLCPEEPQSYRDLALVLSRRAEASHRMSLIARDPSGKLLLSAQADFARAIEMLNTVVMKKWDRFNQIEVIALMELNRLIPKAKEAGVKDIAVDQRLVQLLDVDMRIVLTWDADLTDIDLWVTEPSGEKAYYSHSRTTIGGNVSRDFTQGYGPEEYIVRKAMHGTYKIQAEYYGSSSPTLAGAVTLQADVFTNYGRKTEQCKSITLRLAAKKETVDIGEIEF